MKRKLAVAAAVAAAVIAAAVLIRGCTAGGGSTTCNSFMSMTWAQREAEIGRWRPILAAAQRAGTARLVYNDCSSMHDVGGTKISDLDDNFINHY